MSTKKSELSNLASQYMHGGYTPNSSDEIIRVVDPVPALTGFLVTLQRRGADMSRWTEAEWRQTLDDEFGVDEDHLPDYIEDVASWGVVDDAQWEED